MSALGIQRLGTLAYLDELDTIREILDQVRHCRQTLTLKFGVEPECSETFRPSLHKRSLPSTERPKH